MNKRQGFVLIQKAVNAFNNDSPDFQSIMDDASVKLSDEQWLALQQALEEASKTPRQPDSPEQEQDRLERTVERLRTELRDAEARLYAFYGKKQGKKKARQ
jgi:hypothetical protein